jgi:hypothetical protein
VGKPYFIETTDFGLPTKTHFDMTMKSSNTLWSFGSIITTAGYDTHWDALMSKRLVNMEEVYAELQKKWPGKAADINEVFVAHDFFKDTNKGNGKYDLHEPYWDEDPDGKGSLPNGKWDKGEVYVDIWTPDDGLLRPHQVFTEGQDRIGKQLRTDYEEKAKAVCPRFIC